MIETRLLHYFLIVAQELNITNASKVLHITQPTLSRQMRMLEEELGVKLFRRGIRPLMLTDEGMLFRRRAEEILELIKKTEEEVSVCEEQVEGTILLGCGELASVHILTKLISEFSKQHPYVTFDVYTTGSDQIKRRIDNGLIDIGLLLEPVDMEQFEYIRMPVKERWIAVIPSGFPLAKQKNVTAKDLSQIPVIMPSRQKVFDEVANWFGEYYSNLNIVATNNLATNAALLAKSEIGCAITVEGGLLSLSQSGVCIVPLSPELPATSALAWKRNQPFSSAILRFMEYIKCSLGIKIE